MSEKHLSSPYDVELLSVSSRVLEMGGLVESQFAKAVSALTSFDGERAEEVLRDEQRVNAFEVEIDRQLSGIIALRQPTARDLRLLIAISRIAANLERAGDEAARTARVVLQLLGVGMPTRLRLPVHDLQFESEMATELLRKALDAFTRLDAGAALEVIRQDRQIDSEFEGLLRKLITYMMEDPRTISSCIDLVFVAKAVERIGDHAKNLAEAVIYVVKGTDVRHTPMTEIERAVQ